MAMAAIHITMANMAVKGAEGDDDEENRIWHSGSVRNGCARWLRMLMRRNDRSRYMRRDR